MNNTVDYIFELGVMKRRKISGYDRYLDSHSTSLATHSYRASMIGGILAEKENANIAKVMLMLIVHENAETRIGDSDFIAHKYFDKNEFEKRAFKDQVSQLPEKLQATFYGLFKEKSKCETLDAKVACDADLLEHMFSAKEYVDQGVKGIEEWYANGEKYLYTESAKAIANDLATHSSLSWQKNVPKT